MDAKAKHEQAVPALVKFVQLVEAQNKWVESVAGGTLAVEPPRGDHFVTYSYR